jgi:hypothetical protein
VRVWNVAETAAEIVSSINASLSTPTTGLVARWGLNEDAETTMRARPAHGGRLDRRHQLELGAGAPFDLAPPQPPRLRPD